MSEAPTTKGKSARVIQAVALIVVFGLLFVATRVAPESRSVVGTIAGLGFLLLAGTLTSELCEMVGLPHLSGYLLAGVVAGPQVLELIDHETIGKLAPVNSLALALIALAGGCELEIEMLRAARKSLTVSTVLQHAVVPIVTGLALYGLAQLTPLASLDRASLVGVAILWGTLAASRSPAALLGVIAQLRPKGPLTTFSIAFVMFSDLVCILMTAFVIAVLKPLFDPSAQLSFADLEKLGFELVGSVALGVCLGIVLTIYLRLVGKNRLLILLAVGVGLSELLHYIQFDALLAFLVAGFFVRNFSEQGPKLIDAIQQTGAVVFVIFFALAGAKLDLHILRQVGLVTLALCVIRALTTIGLARLSSRIADDVPAVRSWGWSSLISQAGLTLGLSVVIARAFPSIATAFSTLAVAAVAINEVIGPILFKLGLDRTGESYMAAPPGDAPPSAS